MHIVVIGASAGGVEALREVVEGLPPDLDAAVFAVLHIPPSAPSELATVLARNSRLPVLDAEDGAAICRGTIRVGVADLHLVLEQDHMRLTRGPREGRMRPSIDVLFRSAALAFAHRVVGVILTGSLDDGTAGLWAVKDRGGTAIVQDPDTAAYRSMPDSAIQNVQVDQVLPLASIAGAVAALTAGPVPGHGVPVASERLRVETLIAEAGNGLQAGVMEIGAISKYTCPDCHGVLVQIQEGSIVRFRCHTGHGFSLQTLLSEVDRSIDDSLRDTVRAVEERIVLLRQGAHLATTAGQQATAKRMRHVADETERRLRPLRDIALDPLFFGGIADPRAPRHGD